MRFSVLLGGFFLLCSFILAGCGGGGADSIKKEIDALKTEAASAKTPEQIQAIGTKAAAIGEKIKNSSLSVDQKKDLSKQLVEATVGGLIPGG